MKIQMIRAISERSTRAMSKKVAAIGLQRLVGAIAVVAGPAGNALAASPTTLTDVATLFCLDSNGNGNVYTGGCNGGNYQNWVMQPTDSNSDFRLVNAQTGRCLDSNASGSVYTPALQRRQLPELARVASQRNSEPDPGRVHTVLPGQQHQRQRLHAGLQRGQLPALAALVLTTAARPR